MAWNAWKQSTKFVRWKEWREAGGTIDVELAEKVRPDALTNHGTMINTSVRNFETVHS